MYPNALHKAIIPFLVFWLPFVAAAQDMANLEGRVADAVTHSPLAGSHVALNGTFCLAVADEMGRFRFYSLSPGSYNLVVTHVGYDSKQVLGIVITAEAPTMIEVRLQPEILSLPDVEISMGPAASAGPLSGGYVITRETLRKSSSSDVAKVLEMEGLATLASDGSPGGNRTVSVRGSGSDQVLVLVDGKPLNRSADGTADLSRISLSEVQQIEVYPQAPSSLGAQAIGGVINIITMKPGLNQYHVETGVSGYGEKRGNLSYGQSLRGWPFLAVVEHRESTGRYRYRVAPDDGLDLFTRNLGITYTQTRADYRRDYLSLKLDPPGAWNMSYRASMLFRHNPDYLPEPALEHESATRDDWQEFNLAISQGDSWYKPSMSLDAEGYSQETTTDYGPQYPLLYGHSRLRGEGYQADLAWKTGAGQWQDVRFGTGIRFERLWSIDLQDGYAERVHEFGYLQVQGDPIRGLDWPIHMGLFSGVRADLYRDQDAFVYPRLGVEIGGGDETYWALRAELVGAYRLPSFNALFWQEGLLASGNPNLKPERSQNQELSGRIGWKTLELGATYFNRKVWDLIYWRLDFDDRWKPLNLARAWIYGMEYTLKSAVHEGPFSTEMLLSHRWMHSVNLSGEPNTDGNLLPYRPENSTTLSLHQDLFHFSMDLSARWIDCRFTNEANTKSLEPYDVWDIGISGQFKVGDSGTSLEVRAQVLNLFNENYRIVSGAPVPLREWWITVALGNQ